MPPDVLNALLNASPVAVIFVIALAALYVVALALSKIPTHKP